ADRNRSHWSTSKTPSYTKSVSWQHHPSDNMSISFRGVLEIGESTVVPDDNTPLLRLENDMAPIAVDALSWVRVPVERHENVIVYIF
ncbi:hypothetical protein VC902_21945, partial [Citrobacter freundii]|nr:hypothetical protein [Citrobacter freundii]